MEQKMNSLWGGRFKEPLDPLINEFNRSLSFDRALFPQDVEASIAWAGALEKAGVLTRVEAQNVREGLLLLKSEVAAKPTLLSGIESDEDVHSFIESRLFAKIGDAAKKVHTGRSRNDQVGTAFRMWVREECDAAILSLNLLKKSLVGLALKNPQGAMPGYTHLQKAQPVLFAHWCLAYVEMITRDLNRFSQARSEANVLPLGSGALAGTSQSVDREALAKSLGFASITRNSLDAVSDRDFALSFLYASSVCLVHLSRLAEDIILYSTQEFGFFELPDSVSTGSSLMPQKKNPDPMELVRGKSGRVVGELMALLMVLKGLPLAYNKDLQEDKEGVFDAARTLKLCCGATRVVLEKIIPRPALMQAAAASGYMNATELADYFVRKGMPFRLAHEAAGKCVIEALEKSVELEALPLSSFQAVLPSAGTDVFEALSLVRTLATKDVPGGTAPSRVQAELARVMGEVEAALVAKAP